MIASFLGLVCSSLNRIVAFNDGVDFFFFFTYSRSK